MLFKEPSLIFGSNLKDGKCVEFPLSSVSNILFYGIGKHNTFFKNLIDSFIEGTQSNSLNFVFLDEHLLSYLDTDIQNIVPSQYINKKLSLNLADIYEDDRLLYLKIDELARHIRLRHEKLNQNNCHSVYDYVERFNKLPFKRIIAFVDVNYYLERKESFKELLRYGPEVDIYCATYASSNVSIFNGTKFDKEFVNLFQTRVCLQENIPYDISQSFFDGISYQEDEIINSDVRRYVYSIRNKLFKSNLPRWSFLKDNYVKYFNDSKLSICRSLDACPSFIAYSNYFCLRCQYRPYHFLNEECPYEKLYSLKGSSKNNYISTIIGANILKLIHLYSLMNTSNSSEDISTSVTYKMIEVFGIKDQLLEKPRIVKGDDSLKAYVKKNIVELANYYVSEFGAKPNYYSRLSSLMIDNVNHNTLDLDDTALLKRFINTPSLVDEAIDFYIEEYNTSCDISTKSKYIKTIVVKHLFGYNSFQIDFNDENKVAIIFGSNGFGKTTLFKMLECLFITDNLDKNQRFNYLLNDVEFSLFSVTFTDNTCISLTKGDNSLTIDYRSRNGEKYYDDLSQLSFKIGDDNSSNINQHYERIKWLFPKLTSLSNRFLFIKTNRVVTLAQIGSYLRKYSKTDNDYHALIQALTKKSLSNPSISLEIDPVFKRPYFIDLFKEKLLLLSSKTIDNYYSLLSSRKKLGKNVPILEKALRIFGEMKEHSFLPTLCEKLAFTSCKSIPDNLDTDSDYLKFIDSLWDLINFYLKYITFKKIFESHYHKYSQEKKYVVLINGELRINTESGKTILFENLSSGELNLANILFGVIYGATEDSIVLIDEPEISLHLAWQQKFADVIKQLVDFQKMQVIAASHSPFITSGDETLLVRPKHLEE